MCIRDKAKVDYKKVLNRLKDKPDGKYINVTAITPTPVSYTHLDVYKRQIWQHTCDKSNNLFEFPLLSDAEGK